jgi:hypothetical protein
LVILGWVTWIGIENIEGAIVYFLLAGMGLAAAPTSLIVAGMFSFIERVVPGVMLPQGLMAKFLVVWTVMLVLSYWQWFYLLPKLVRLVKQRRKKEVST